ncbi:MAG: ABC transporter permease [Lachnospiraceae bacterium]|nr:ABC transporter permease [Lachnospiraceae bacterium]
MEKFKQNRICRGGVWVGRQVLRAAALIVLVSMLAFFLVSVSPIDPLQTNVGQAALGSMSREQIERLEAYWGMDIPPVERYLSWGFDFLSGDMGISLLYRRPVAEALAERLGNSIWLLLFAWVFSGILGLSLGILAGRKRGGFIDRLVTGLSLLIASTPSFWVAMVLLLTFAVQLKWFPIGFGVPIGMASQAVSLPDRLYHAALPAAALSITGISSIALHTREKMIEVMESEYVLFARARGESETQIILRHGLRNILLPAVTLQFASVSEIIGGSVLVEQVFSYPGLGQAAVTAGLGGDVPLLLGITVLTAAVVFSGNLAANLLYHVIDPRIRRGASG